MSSAREPGLAEVINRAVQLALARMFKVRVGRIEKFDASTGLADVKLLQKEIREGDGETVIESVAVVSNAVVLCLGGGEYADTYPVEEGDECVVLCADRSLDVWFEKGSDQDQDPVDLRRHNPSDAIAIVGLRSKPNKLTEWPTDRREIGKQGGVKVAVKESEVHLGVDSGEDASDQVALAPATKDELNALRDAHNDLVNAFNQHIHQLTSQGAPVFHKGQTLPVTSQAQQADPVGDINAEKVYAK